MTLSRKELGDRAEEKVVEFLVARGAMIVARNVRLGMLEIDIVARLNELILVVEVRYRSEQAWTTGLSSVDLGKRQRIRRAGERLWNRRFKNDSSAQRMRFDVASVTFSDDQFDIEYIPAAF